jgi:hypothetical protein
VVHAGRFRTALPFAIMPPSSSAAGVAARANIKAANNWACQHRDFNNITTLQHQGKSYA